MKKLGLFLLILTGLFVFFAPMGICAVSTDEISKIEKEIFDATFPKNTISQRLSNIEKEIYGTDFTKLSEEKRLEKIKTDLGQNTDKITQIQPQLKSKEEGDYPIVDRFETKIFKTTYKNENIYKRLDRLETKVFGIKNEKSSLSERVSVLKKAIPLETLAHNNPISVVQAKDGVTQMPKTKKQVGKYSSNRNYDTEVGSIEQQIFGRVYSGDIMPRLSRIENELFQTEFSADDTDTRLERLGAVMVAQRTSGNYDNNKAGQFLSAGMQIGSVILLLLSIIL